MFVKLNPELIIEDFDEGKLITEIVSLQAHYMEQGVFDFLAPAADEYMEVAKLFPEIYTEEEVMEFINDLLEKRVLFRRE